MVISALEKFTLLDYPGKTSAVIFTFGCNLSCPFCHNPELKHGDWNKMNIYSQDEIYKFMKSRVGKLDALTITGGEPSIHPDLPDFIKRIKSLGFLIKLDTNGVNAEKIKTIAELKLVDYWAIDVKGDIELYKRCGFELDSLDNIKQSIKAIKNSGADYEFRTTFLKTWHTDTKVNEIGKLITPAKAFYVQNFRPGKTLDPDMNAKDIMTHEDLERVKKIMSKYVESVDIRDF